MIIIRYVIKDLQVLETIGIEPEFWDIFPEASIFADRDFEDLSFKQRVWLLKTICDTLMVNKKKIIIIIYFWRKNYLTLII